MPRPLTSLCGVCGSPADSVRHYGAIACYPCRAFFRRACSSTKRRPCVTKIGGCYDKPEFKSNCKKCRLEKCLQVGMIPEKVDRVKRKHLEEKKVKESQNVSKVLSLDETPSPSKNEEIEEVVNMDVLVDECIHLEKESEDKEKSNDETSFLVENPDLSLTHEEEFKIYELLVRRENLVDGMFKMFFRIPGFLEKFKRSLFSMNGSIHDDFIKVVDQRFHLIVKSLLEGGTIRKSLDMFDEFKHVSENVKKSVTVFSISVLRICNRALVKVNKDKEWFIDQHIAAGLYTPTLKETYAVAFQNNRYAVRSLDPFSTGYYLSPWASSSEDEEFFMRTLEFLGSIVKDDLLLGALYSTLLLATPGALQDLKVKTDPALLRVQNELTLLLYRYCKKKYGDSNIASDTTHWLLKLLGDLHICRDILTNCRLPFPSVDEIKDYSTIDDIEIGLLETK